MNTREQAETVEHVNGNIKLSPEKTSVSPEAANSIRKKRRKFTSYQIFSAILATILVVGGSFIFANRAGIVDMLGKLTTHLVIWLCFLLAFIVLIANYLFSRVRDLSDEALAILKYRAQVRQLEDKISDMRAELSVAHDKINRSSHGYHKVTTSDLIDDFVAREEGHVAPQAEDFTKIKSRLSQDIDRINRISNINLLIGILTTGIAIFLLWTTLTSVKIPHPDGDTPLSTQIQLYVFQLLPRVTLSLLIQLFSFFFLRMYRRSYNDIKYFNNEMTNVEAKLLALKTARELMDTELVRTVVTELTKTDRNQFMKKSETTTELERERINAGLMEKFMSEIGKYMPNFGKKAE